jgi:serine/threonine protein kinase
MEWMGGGDLLQFLARRPLPKLQRRLSLFRQICAGLNSLHSHSPDPIIHSDLKPANILLDSDEKIAKIADFGLSKIKTASYAGSNAVGTMLYFAPEMLLKGALSHRPTDVYAMGLIFWEMLTGKPVWHNPDGSPFQPFQLIAKYNGLERPSLDELPPGLDPAVIALMQDCWAQDPAQRPTADELWQRMSALDPNNPEHNKPLQLYPDDFAPTCGTLEDCLRLAVPSDVFNGLLRDMPAIRGKYFDNSTQAFVRTHGLSEVEAKCIIMFTHESPHVPDHPRPLDPKRPKRDNQLYFLFNKACRERDAAAIQRFQNFSFHFVSALNKLPNFPLAAGQSLYRGFGQRLEEMNDLYRDGSAIWWHYTSSSSLHRATAYKDFARRSGTLMEITRVCNAKDIRPLSMIPAEGELLIPPNTDFKVKLALSCDQAQALNERYTTIPDNVDLVILEAAPARRPGIIHSSSHASFLHRASHD